MINTHNTICWLNLTSKHNMVHRTVFEQIKVLTFDHTVHFKINIWPKCIVRCHNAEQDCQIATGHCGVTWSVWLFLQVLDIVHCKMTQWSVWLFLQVQVLYIVHCKMTQCIAMVTVTLPRFPTCITLLSPCSASSSNIWTNYFSLRITFDQLILQHSQTRLPDYCEDRGHRRLTWSGPL